MPCWPQLSIFEWSHYPHQLILTQHIPLFFRLHPRQLRHLEPLLVVLLPVLLLPLLLLLLLLLLHLWWSTTLIIYHPTQLIQTPTSLSRRRLLRHPYREYIRTPTAVPSSSSIAPALRTLL